MKNRSLKFKLIVGGLLAAILPLTIVGLFSINKSSTALLSLAKAQAEMAAPKSCNHGKSIHGTGDNIGQGNGTRALGCDGKQNSYGRRH